ncbi:MAG: hypothetical protein HY462_00595 [Parcubacteria group bacterium]|nr:hypothetical protein [Parcubacteria group bacterium]
MPKEYISVTEFAVARSTLASGGSLHITTLTSEDSTKGCLVFFIEIETSDKDNEQIIALLERELEKQYFHAPTESVEFSFENALAKSNVAVKDILLSKPKNWLTKIHVLALALAEEEVHFSSVGSVHAFLTHQERIVDILAGAGNAAAIPNPVKLFSNIVSGRLLPEDAITLASDAVLDYLSIERIRKITNEYDPRGALEKLFELLSQAPGTKQFGLAVSKRVARVSQVKEREPQDSESSILDEYFQPQESETGEFLREGSRTLLAATGAFARRTGSLILAGTLSGAGAALEWMERELAVLVPKLLRLPSLAAGLWRNRRARDYHFSQLKSAVKIRVSSVPERFKELPRSRKAVVAAIVTLGVVFALSISLRAQQRAETTAQESYRALVAEIETKRDQAQATLIYREESRAREIIGEALALLEKLPRGASEEQERYESLKNELRTLLDRSQKKQALSDIMALATIIPKPIAPNQTGLLTVGDRIVLYDGVGERFAAVDTEQGLVLTLPFENQGVESFNAAVPLDNTTIAAINQETAMFVDTARETIRKESFVFDPATVTPFTSYAGNLYTISKTQDEIIRYREAGRGFTTAQKWLQEEYDLSGMVDIAVDGSVYTLHASGDIHVFANGAPSAVIPFPLPDDRPGTNLSFYANENTKNFYLLDPEKQRILTVSKQGELEIQLIAKEFASATDVVASRDETALYVLAGDTIYRIPITQ